MISAANHQSTLSDKLSNVDPEVWGLLQEEKQRQLSGLELIASEVSEGLFKQHSVFIVLRKKCTMMLMHQGVEKLAY